jgi:GrpB-like predicted nucleotidyltransferase (UPF0157 family)
VKKPIGLERGLVKLEDYSPAWAVSYQAEEHLIRDLFPDGIVAIAHVGSTSIPGIRSKPIIDIILVLRSDLDLEMAADKLASVGFLRGDFIRDEGIFLLKMNGTLHTHYLHMVSAHHAWQKYIFFRDYMIGHPGEAVEYERLKLALGNLYEKDRPLYTAAKKDFIQAIMAKMPADYPCSQYV